MNRWELDKEISSLLEQGFSEEEEKPKQLALDKLSFEDRITLAKSLKKAVEQTSDIEEKRYYKTRIRELFTDEEWEILKERKRNNEGNK